MTMLALVNVLTWQFRQVLFPSAAGDPNRVPAVCGRFHMHQHYECPRRSTCVSQLGGVGYHGSCRVRFGGHLDNPLLQINDYDANGVAVAASILFLRR